MLVLAISAVECHIFLQRLLGLQCFLSEQEKNPTLVLVWKPVITF